MLSRILFKFSIKTKLIETSLQLVPKYGWSFAPIHVACTLLDLSPASHRLITPYQLIHYKMSQWNKQSLQTIDDTNFNQQKRIQDKIRFAIRNRLEREKEFIDTWGQAMRIGAEFSNIQRTRDLLWDYSSQAWYKAGDKSTDYNHYTKRILFNTAYASTELFMLTDKSKDFNATWEFLDRRLQNILTAGKYANDLGTVLGHAGNGVLSLFTMFKTPQKYQHPIESYQSKVEHNSEQKKVEQKVEQIKIEQFTSASQPVQKV